MKRNDFFTLLTMLILFLCSCNNDQAAETATNDSALSLDSQNLKHGISPNLEGIDTASLVERALIYIDSIGFTPDTIPRKLPSYAYKDLHSVDFFLVKHGYFYELNTFQHSALENSIKKLAWIDSITCIRAFYLRSKNAVNEIGIDCVMEVWDFDDAVKVDLNQMSSILNHQYGLFYYQYKFLGNSMFLIHARSNTHKWLVDNVYLWIESQGKSIKVRRNPSNPSCR